MKLKKHRTLILAGAFVFVIAWALWTFVSLPKADVNGIEPVTPPTQVN